MGDLTAQYLCEESGVGWLHGDPGSRRPTASCDSSEDSVLRDLFQGLPRGQVCGSVLGSAASAGFSDISLWSGPQLLCAIRPPLLLLAAAPRPRRPPTLASAKVSSSPSHHTAVGTDSPALCPISRSPLLLVTSGQGGALAAQPQGLAGGGGCPRTAGGTSRKGINLTTQIGRQGTPR